MDFHRRIMAFLALPILIAAPAAAQSPDTQLLAKDLRHLVGLPGDDQSLGTMSRSSPRIVDEDAAIKADPESYWGGKGIWADHENYCRQLLDFISGSMTPGYFRYADSREAVTVETLSEEERLIEGNYLLRSEPDSPSHFCVVGYFRQAGYNGISCIRTVSYGRPDVFASLYNRTLKDMQDCLLPAGWEQASSNQRPCSPSEHGMSQCARTFIKGSRGLWLYSNIVGKLYAIGIQTMLGEWQSGNYGNTIRIPCCADTPVGGLSGCDGQLKYVSCPHNSEASSMNLVTPTALPLAPTSPAGYSFAMVSGRSPWMYLNGVGARGIECRRCGGLRWRCQHLKTIIQHPGERADPYRAGGGCLRLAEHKRLMRATGLPSSGYCAAAQGELARGVFDGWTTGSCGGGGGGRAQPRVG